MNTQKNFLLSVLTILVLFFQLMRPITVRADDGTTPPPDVTPEVTTTPVPTDVTDVPEMTSIPPLTELTVDPVETSTPLPTTDSTEIVAESPVPTEPVPTEIVDVEEPTVAEVLADIPAGTDLVVLDENGNPEPLVSQEAAEIIATGDPMWCPDGVLPGGVGCTPSFTSVSELNTALSSGMYNGSGTIYFTSTYSTNDVTFDGYSLYWLTDLTIQGGWNGMTESSFALSGNTIFTVPISITNWNGNLTVNNITVDGTYSTGLNIDTIKDVTINRSNFKNNGINGVSISNVNTITISNSIFNGNYEFGLSVNSSNSLTVRDSNFDRNGQFDSGLLHGGANISSNTSSIYNSTFNNNSDFGNDVGALIFGNNTSIYDSTFNGNSYEGVNIFVDGNSSISNSTFDGNAGWGAEITSDNSRITKSSFSGNGDNGLQTWSHNSNITNSIFNGNGGDGAYISFGNSAIISNSIFSGNSTGLFVYQRFSTNNVDISNSVFGANTTGIETDTTGMYTDGSININLNCVEFLNNGKNILPSKDVTVTENPCLPPDRDIDGIIDSDDACPDIPGIKTDNPLTNGCPLLPDRDTDGIIDSVDACPDVPGVKTDDPLTNGCPQKLISVEGNSKSFTMDCSLFSSYNPVWGDNGDRVVISCVPNGAVDIDRVENTDLPGVLEKGYQYASGLIVRISENGVPLAIMPEDGFIQVSFAAEESDAQYGIMYWDEDASKWVLLEEFQPNPNGTAMQFPLYPPQDSRTIKRGTQLTPGNPKWVEATTNFTGIFVLVVQQ